MAYTKEQQDQIDAATKKVNNAQTALTNAQNTVASYYKIMGDKFAAGSLSPNDCYNNKPASLDAQLGYGQMDQNSCKGILGWATCGGCPPAVIDFNAAYSNWKNTISTVLTPAQTAYNQAKKDLSDLLASLKQEVQNDPAYLLQLQQLALQAKLATKKYWFWGIVIVVIGIAVFLFFRWRKGKVI